jgi:hypothetical protein
MRHIYSGNKVPEGLRQEAEEAIQTSQELADSSGYPVRVLYTWGKSKGDIQIIKAEFDNYWPAIYKANGLDRRRLLVLWVTYPTYTELAANKIILDNGGAMSDTLNINSGNKRT